jgi:hypothetical protein
VSIVEITLHVANVDGKMRAVTLNVSKYTNEDFAFYTAACFKRTALRLQPALPKQQQPALYDTAAATT